MARTPATRKISWPEPAPPPAPEPTTALARQGTSLAERSFQVRVVDEMSYALAVELVRAVKQYTGDVHALTDKAIKAADLAHKEALKVRATLLAPAVQAEAHIKGEIDRHDAAMVLARREEQAALERERQRLEMEEWHRVENEKVRLRAEAEAARAVEAQAVAAQGDVALARRIAETPVEIAPVPQQPVFVPPLQTVVPKAAGVTISETFVARVTSLETLVKAVAEGTVSLAVLKPDQQVLDKIAKAMREHFNIPGVEAVPVRTVGVKV